MLREAWSEHGSGVIVPFRASRRCNSRPQSGRNRERVCTADPRADQKGRAEGEERIRRIRRIGPSPITWSLPVTTRPFTGWAATRVTLQGEGKKPNRTVDLGTPSSEPMTAKSPHPPVTAPSTSHGWARDS